VKYANQQSSARFHHGAGTRLFTAACGHAHACSSEFQLKPLKQRLDHIEGKHGEKEGIHSISLYFSISN
jgi:hypothetical protein